MLFFKLPARRSRKRYRSFKKKVANDFSGRSDTERHQEYQAALIIDQATGGNLAASLLEEIKESELTHEQAQLLNAFYSGRREAIDRNRAPYATLCRLACIINYESDLAVEIMQALDDHLMQLIAEKDKRDHEKAMAKAGGR